MDSPRKRSTLHRLSVVCPMNDNTRVRFRPRSGDSVLASTRYTTFLSTSTPNGCAMMGAIRGQPNRGLRDVSSTMAGISASPGPFGPRFLRHGLATNSPRYLRRTRAARNANSVDGRTTMASFRMRSGLRKSDPNPQSSRSFSLGLGGPFASTAQNDQLLLEQKILGDHPSRQRSHWRARIVRG